MIDKKTIIIPSEEEDKRIRDAAHSDCDNPPLTLNQLSRAVLSREIPEKVSRLKASAAKGVRGPQKAPLKVDVHMKLDPDIITHFKRDGKGWQTRINEALREFAGLK